jgi:hypothetical protein
MVEVEWVDRSGGLEESLELWAMRREGERGLQLVEGKFTDAI